MKQTRKIFVALLVLMTILMSLVVVAIPASAAEGDTEIKFNLGANGSASHNDGTEATTYSETVNGYTLSITGGTEMYKGARDAKGNSCIKLGTSKVVGGFKFTVPDDVQSVVIEAAKYKANTSKLKVNSTTYTLSNASNDGKYDVITVDTSTNKTVTLTTVASNYRAMINSITFVIPFAGDADCEHTNVTSTPVAPTCTEAGYTENECADCGAKLETTPGEPALGHTDANGDFKCEVCSKIAAPAADEALTTEQANTLGKLHAHNTYTDNKYYVTGTITKIVNTTYGNFYIKDATGKELYVYGLYSSNGSTRYDSMTTKPAVGDEVTVYGIIGQYNSSAQMKNAWLDELVVHEHSYDTVKQVVDPTSTTEGYTVYSCSCGKTENRDFVPTVLAGSGTETDPYIIKSAADLEKFRASVNAGETKYNAPGVWVALGADIDLEGTTWTEGIGDGHNWSFDGNFDGKNFTIKNLTITPYADSENPDTAYICGGLFGYVYGNVTIKNLVLENVSVSTDAAGHNVGALVGFAYGTQITIDNITVKGDVKIDTPNAYGTGAILGYSYYTKVDISNSKVVANEGSYIKGYSYVGGITGYSASNATFTNCSVSGLNITGTSYSVGGIAGLVLSGNTFSGCEVDATVSGKANVGSIVGAIGSQGTTITFENCTAQGSPVGGNYGDNKPVVAVIDNKYYSSLADAFAAGGEVTLLVNVELDAPIVIDGSVTLNLAGCTLSYATGEWNENMITINANGSLVINDSSSLTRSGSATGAISFVFTGAADTSYGKGNYAIVNNGSLTLNSGSIQVAAAGVEGTFSHALYAIQNAGDLTINGGSVVNNNNIAIRNWNDANITVNGGEISGTRAIWVQLPSGASAAAPEINIAINGGTLTATEQTYNLAIYVYSYGQSAEKLALTINDGVINGNVALYVNDATLADNAVKVTGGEINGEYGVFSYSDDDALAASKIAITGGEFKTDYSAKYAEDDGFIFIQNAEGTYSTLKGSLATPSIQEVDGVKYWFIGTVNTGIKAEGIDGENGQPGENGQDGVTPIFQIANGFIQVSYDNGTTWENLVALDDIKGETGETGPQGPQGDKGETGEQGPQGDKGDKGEQGETGAQGPQGEKGDKGDQGEQGIQGEKGDNADATKEVRTAIAIATVAIIFALAVLLFWRVKRRSWWCYR